MQPSDPSPAVTAAFLERYLADLEAGNPQSLESYQGLYPGHEEVIAREFERLTAEAEGPGHIAHYAVLRELGRGGQGTVWLARDTRLGREVALKVLPDHGLHTSAALARFRREAEIAAQLDHPGICTVLDTGQADGVVYIAMRYVDGETLAARVAGWRREAEQDGGAAHEARDRVLEIVRLFERIARAVDAAHEAGILHRDLKPANVIVTRGGDPVVLDFGLARDAGQGGDGGGGITRTGEVFGTPWYMPPEQLRGTPVLDRRGDVYALGASLYECLTLHRPVDAATRESLYQAILTAPPADPKRWNRGVPRDLATVLEIALEKERDRRYASAAALAEDLRRIVAYEPIVARPPSAWTKGWRWVQRNRVVASLAALLFVVLAVGLAVSLSALGDSERAREELSAALEDIQAGKESRRQQAIEAKLLAGYQALYSADPRPAVTLFEEVLELDPVNLEALAGRVWLESDSPERAVAQLDALVGAEGVAARLAGDRQVVWLREFLEDPRRGGAVDADTGGWTALRLYFDGLRAVRNFSQAVDPAQLRAGFGRFRDAALRAERPRFQHHHSMLMAAARLGERAWMDAAAVGLEFHWPEAPATHEAIAQFYLPVDRARGERALRWLAERTGDRSPTPHLGLAHLAQMDGDFEAAAGHLDRAVAADGTFMPGRMMRGGLRLQRGDAAGAREDFLAAIRSAPEQGMLVDGLRRVHAALGDPVAALRDWEGLAREFPESQAVAGALRAAAELVRSR